MKLEPHPEVLAIMREIESESAQRTSNLIAMGVDRTMLSPLPYETVRAMAWQRWCSRLDDTDLAVFLQSLAGIFNRDSEHVHILSEAASRIRGRPTRRKRKGGR